MFVALFKNARVSLMSRSYSARLPSLTPHVFEGNDYSVRDNLMSASTHISRVGSERNERGEWQWLGENACLCGVSAVGLWLPALATTYACAYVRTVHVVGMSVIVVAGGRRSVAQRFHPRATIRAPKTKPVLTTHNRNQVD
jgi:hypothetical protein